MRKLSVRIARWFLIPVAALALAACSSGVTAAPSNQATGSGGTTLKPGKVGILLASATTQLSAEADLVKKALGEVQWTSATTDGQNSPTVQQTALQDFIQQKVQGIITISITSAVVAPQLQQAKAAGIPVISLADDANPTAFDANYGGDASQQAKLTASYVKAKLPAGSPYVTLDISGIYSIHQFITSTTALLDAEGFQHVGNYDINLADLTNSIKTGALNLVQAHPNARLLYGCSSVCIPIVAAAFEQAGIRNVLIVANSFPQDKPTFSVIAGGSPAAANIQNFDVDSLIAVDQILKHTATGASIDRNADNGVYQSAMVDKANVPSSGAFTGTTATQHSHFDDSQLLTQYVSEWKKAYAISG